MSVFENTAQILMALGVAFAAIDIILLGFSTFFLTIIGLGTLTTGVLIHFGVITDKWTVIALSIAVSSAVYSALLWKPLSNLQKSEGPKAVHSDLIGHQFLLETPVTPSKLGSYHYSGITWKIESDQELNAGERVEVIDLQVGIMKVKALIQ